MTEAETSFLFFLAKNEPVTDSLSETRDNPDHSYHHIPEDSQVVANGMKFGIDVAGRHVYRVGRGRNEMFYAWDRQEGEWEIYDKRLRHKGAVRDGAEAKHKGAIPKRRLAFRSKL